MANCLRDLNLEGLWRRRLNDWQRSGLSGREFCRRRRLSEPSFYNWRGVIAQRDCEQSDTKRGLRSTSAFVPVRVISASPIEVVIRSGQTLHVGVGFDAAHLRAVVAALEAGAC
jgi:hypothetical protein